MQTFQIKLLISKNLNDFIKSKLNSIDFDNLNSLEEISNSIIDKIRYGEFTIDQINQIKENYYKLSSLYSKDNLSDLGR